MTRDPVRAALRVIGEREREEFGEGEGEGRRVRPLEDVQLVGEEAAAKARKERLEREGVEVLVREDKRWDWLLGEFWSLGRGWRGVCGTVLTVNSSDGRLGREGEELEEVSGEEAEDEDGEDREEAGAGGVYGDWEVGGRRRSRSQNRRDTIDGYEAFFGFGVWIVWIWGNGRIESNNQIGIRYGIWDTYMRTVCGLHDGVWICYEGWDGSNDSTLVGISWWNLFVCTRYSTKAGNWYPTGCQSASPGACLRSAESSTIYASFGKAWKVLSL